MTEYQSRVNLKINTSFLHRLHMYEWKHLSAQEMIPGYLSYTLTAAMRALCIHLTYITAACITAAVRYIRVYLICITAAVISLHIYLTCITAAVR